MFLRLVIVFALALRAHGCDSWDQTFRNTNNGETWLNGILSANDYLLKQDEGIVFADETDVHTFERFGNDIAIDAHQIAITTLTTSTLQSHPTLTSEEDIEEDDVYSQLYVKRLKDVGVDLIVKNAWGITYSFYQSTGGCKSPQQIESDVKKLHEFDVIRVYDTDCEGLLSVAKLLRPGQQIFAGIYYLDDIERSVDIISQAVDAVDGDWSVIHTVSVGNELINFNKATPAEIAIAVDRTRHLLNDRGFEGYVVSTDTLVAVMNHRELCDVSDYISVNSHPYWDGYVAPQDAGPWLKQQMTLLLSICGTDKNIVLCETGWPTRGLRFGERGVPSKDNQLIALKSIVDTLGPDTILFTTHNDYWKADGSHRVEKFWGIYAE